MTKLWFSLKKAWLAVILAISAVVIITPAVLAHGFLVRSDPAGNSTLTDPPQEVRLWFSEPISPDFSSAQLLDINGQPIELTNILVDSADPNLMILKLPELPNGLYNLRWKVLSEADGHFTQGPLVFGVGTAADLGAEVSVVAENPVPWPEVLLRWLNFGALMALTGGVVVAYLVLAPAGFGFEAEDPIAMVRRVAQWRVLGWTRWWAGLALLVGFGLLAWQVIVVKETLPATVPVWEAGWQLLNRTRWGLLWLGREGILLALIGFSVRCHAGSMQSASSPARRLLLLATGLLLLALLAVQALTGHAAALTANLALAVVVDALHLLAASLWVGGLLALVIGLLPLIHQDRADFKTLALTTWRPFSRLAVFSVALLVATGLYNTGRQIASIDALLTTLYGQVLLTKIGLMLAVGMVGLLNSMLLHPRLAAPIARWLGRPAGWTPLSLQRLPALVLAEAGLGLLVILITGMLTAAPPARGPEFEVTADEISTMLSQTIDDMIIGFSASPNRPGQNVFSIRAVSPLRPPPAEVIRVILRFTFLNEEMGQSSVDAVEIEPDLYQAGGSFLSLAGPWQVQVVIRRAGMEDAVANFRWIVAPPGEARPVIVSNRSLEPSLTLAAAVIILMISLVLIGLRLGWRKLTILADLPARLMNFSRESQQALKLKGIRNEKH